MSYLRHAPGSRQTPQSQPIPGSSQIPNSAGGYSWSVDPLARLSRFLVLGSEGGSYYATERELTKENVDSLAQCDPYKAIDLIVAVSEEGRAPKNDPALYALAYYAGKGHPRPTAEDVKVRQYALERLPKVARIGTHLFHFLAFVETQRGWGRSLRRAVGRWFVERPEEALTYQLVKYRQRDGWDRRDPLRLAHPARTVSSGNPTLDVSDDQARIFDWVCGRTDAGAIGGVAEGFAKAQAAKTPAETAALVAEYNLPREALNTDHMISPEVWEALLYAGQKTIETESGPKVVGGMPLTALIRNLATMTRVGLIAPMGPHQAEITRRITDADALKASRVHPLAVLAALMTYQSGKSVRGTSTWEPNSRIVDALDASFYASFGNVEPTGKRMLLAIDVSSSMDGMVHYGHTPPQWVVNGRACVNGVPGLTARIAAAAMALVTAAVEPDHYFLAFSHELVPLEISPRERLDAVVRKMQAIPFGGTNAALPMLWASGARVGEATQRYDPRTGRYVNEAPVHDGGKTVDVDAFVLYTDAETWHGGIHPSQALQHYREKSGIPARSVAVAMVSNAFSIADPNDPGQLDVVGFDAAAPQVISDFISGKL